MSWPDWLTHSGRFTHKVIICQQQIGHRAGNVRQPKTGILTTELRWQHERHSSNDLTCFPSCRQFSWCSANLAVSVRWRSNASIKRSA